MDYRIKLVLEAGVDELSEEQMLQVYAAYGTTAEALRQDTQSLREWVRKQPHLPNLTGEQLAVLPNSVKNGKLCLTPSHLRQWE